jgi:hypothetical protein
MYIYVYIYRVGVGAAPREVPCSHGRQDRVFFFSPQHAAAGARAVKAYVSRRCFFFFLCFLFPTTLQGARAVKAHVRKRFFSLIFFAIFFIFLSSNCHILVYSCPRTAIHVSSYSLSLSLARFLSLSLSLAHSLHTTCAEGSFSKENKRESALSGWVSWGWGAPELGIRCKKMEKNIKKIATKKYSCLGGH